MGASFLKELPAVASSSGTDSLLEDGAEHLVHAQWSMPGRDLGRMLIMWRTATQALLLWLQGYTTQA